MTWLWWYNIVKIVHSYYIDSSHEELLTWPCGRKEEHHTVSFIVMVGKKVVCSLRFCVSSLHRDHANLLCIYIALFNVRDRSPGQLMKMFNIIYNLLLFRMIFSSINDATPIYISSAHGNVTYYVYQKPQVAYSLLLRISFVIYIYI